MDQESVKTLVQSIVGDYAWLFVISAAALLLKNSMENFVAGIRFYYGSDYNVDDEVYIKGTKKARIVRQTFSKTVFYLEESNRKLVMPNTSLHTLNIEKVLPSEHPEM